MDREMCEMFHSDGKEIRTVAKKTTVGKRVKKVKGTGEEVDYLTQINQEIANTFAEIDTQIANALRCWDMPPVVRPRTVCWECRHYVDWDDVLDVPLDLCGATVVMWSPVTGEPTYAQCVDENQGECEKWEALPPDPPIDVENELAPRDLFPGPMDNAPLVAPMSDFQPDPTGEPEEMFPQPAPARWWVAIMMAILILLGGAAVVLWAAWQNGWRL